ncbi:IQ motif and ubiquitin-like domain-containing protein [Chironomus tepperi]|uniref:IQ motif and ubiquitin-like domain-containing protein n=1 Tax=Chironomus tepperi TaxID=113505 RepID=UPI00391FA19B
MDTSKDESTQYFGDANEALFVPTNTDTELIPNKDFETFEELQIRINTIEKVRLIQRNFRLCRLKKCIRECASEFRRISAIKKKQEEKIKQDYINANRKSDNFPRTKKDFDVLFAQIATWKETETKRISKEFTGPTRVIEIQALLEKEIQLLNGIEKRRLEIQGEIQAARQDRILKQCGEPIKWIGYRNTLIEMDTIRTQRARTLTELFTLLRQPMKNLDDRLRLLNDISEALCNENTSRIIELENLFERERELLRCKVSDDTLKILRERQLVVFLDVIKDDEHNKSKKSITHICEKCKAVLPLRNFAMHSKQKYYDLCQKCASLKSSKTDLSVYRAILRGIQRDERKRGAFASFAFIIQETDVRHIIENIWHGISLLSQCNVTSDLRLCRWNINEEWSPWNCICLTDTEARIHVKCCNLESIYGEKIMAECRSRHSLAKSTYKHLKKIDSTFVESGNWHECGMKDKIV